MPLAHQLAHPLAHAQRREDPQRQEHDRRQREPLAFAQALLTRLPAACPPILIAQHMPEHFTRTYADRLDRICPMRVVEAEDRQVVESGVAYVAPGNRHMLVEREGVRLVIRLSDAPAVHHQRPAVDVLFRSVAKLHAVKVVALLLTGMGQDGADGMVELRQHGAETIAEHEQSCVVFGMPREAIARGGACHVASLLRMPSLTGGPRPDLKETAEDAHEMLFWLLVFVAAGHAAAALWHHFHDRDGVLRRMLPGRARSDLP